MTVGFPFTCWSHRTWESLLFISFSFLAHLCPSPIPPLAQPLCFPKWVIRRPAKPQHHPIHPLIFIGSFSSFPARSLISVHAGTSRCFVSQFPSWNRGMEISKRTHTLSRSMQIKTSLAYWETGNQEYRLKVVGRLHWNSVQHLQGLSWVF